MNAAVRAVARIGKERGLKVKGIRKGYKWTVKRRHHRFNTNRNSRYDLPWRYNPFTARCEEFKTEEGQKRGAEDL